MSVSLGFLRASSIKLEFLRVKDVCGDATIPA